MKISTFIFLLIAFIPITCILAENQSPPENISTERQTELVYLLKQDCGSCHGMTLQGGLGPALLPESLANKPPEFLVQTILDGRPSTAMPPWRELLTKAEITWLVDTLLQGVNITENQQK
jgi:cytochrome c55X